MLILTRNIGQAIIINSDIKVTVLSADHNQVRLGVDAPKEITVHREEIQERVNRGELPRNRQVSGNK